MRPNHLLGVLLTYRWSRGLVIIPHVALGGFTIERILPGRDRAEVFQFWAALTIFQCWVWGQIGILGLHSRVNFYTSQTFQDHGPTQTFPLVNCLRDGFRQSTDPVYVCNVLVDCCDRVVRKLNALNPLSSWQVVGAGSEWYLSEIAGSIPATTLGSLPS